LTICAAINLHQGNGDINRQTVVWVVHDGVTFEGALKNHDSMPQSVELGLHATRLRHCSKTFAKPFYIFNSYLQI
jgi:hypothetical protein